MTRRHPRTAPVSFALVAVLAAGASGCATFSDNDAVARVGDAELSADEFEARTAEFEAGQIDPLTGQTTADADPDRVQGDLARNIVAEWVTLQLASDAGVIDRYANGFDDLPIACVMVFPIADTAAAGALVDELETGAAWADVLAREAPDAVGLDRQQCIPTDTLGADLMDQIAGMSPSDPYRVVDGAPALVVRAQTVDELLGRDLLTALQSVDPQLVGDVVARAADSDVYVDPRVGTFDAVTLSVNPVN